MPELNGFLASAVLGLFVCLVISALQFAGIISVIVARLFLAFAWLVAVVGVCASLEHAPTKHLVIAAIVIGVPLGLLLVAGERWITRTVQRRESSATLGGQKDTAKRDYLINRLSEFLKRADAMKKGDPLYLANFTFGVGGEIKHFLRLHLPGDVQRFEDQGLDAVEEIIRELSHEDGDIKQRYKLLLDVDVALGMDGWEPRQSSLVLFRDQGIFNPPGIEPVLIDRYELRVGLRVRFDNRDSSPQREQRVSVVLRTETDSYELHVAAYEDKRYIQTLSDVLVQGGDVSPYFDLTCDTNLEIETVKQLGFSSFLRVTLEAINQDLYCVDLDVDWDRAREGKEVHFTVRRKGQCIN